MGGGATTSHPGKIREIKAEKASLFISSGAAVPKQTWMEAGGLLAPTAYRSVVEVTNGRWASWADACLSERLETGSKVTCWILTSCNRQRIYGCRLISASRNVYDVLRISAENLRRSGMNGDASDRCLPPEAQTGGAQL